MSNDAESRQVTRRLVLVRHGETVGESSVRYFGATDLALSQLGLQQMERVRVALETEVFDAVYTSELQRTVSAARIIAPALRAQPLAGFNEINFGRWEGWTRDEIAARDPELFQRWRAALHEFTYPNGDAVAAFRARVVATLHAWLPTAPPRALLIAHKGTIASIVTELRRLSLAERAALAIDLASIHTLVATADGTWHAERMNHTAHLDGLQ